MYKEKKIIYISAIYISPSNTMGGNTKILMELINNLCDYYQFVVFTSEPETFKKNIKFLDKIKLIEIGHKFKKFSYFGHFKEIMSVYIFYRMYFEKNKIRDVDYFYSASDAAPDVIPIYILKSRYNFRWIASLFLFIPSPFENFRNSYKFPFFKYIVYYFYQRYIFSRILKKFDLCLITNDADKKFFPDKKNEKLLAIYGGVNVDQIDDAIDSANFEDKFDVIFCSRLHPQKGISQLLDVWSMVSKIKKDAKLGIVGNGEREFEDYLKNKAKKLKIEDSVKWFGYLNNEGKYRLYFQSRLLAHSTIYDNNGMVAAEALCSGLPVVMYDLDKLKFYQEGCLKVEVGNKIKYAEAILKLINDEGFYEKIKPSPESVLKLKEMWRWENRANIFKNFLDSYEKNHH